MWKRFTILLLCSAIAAGETVHLSDGTSVHGKIYRSGANWTLVLPNGTTRTLSAAEVVSIDFSADGSSSADLDDQLASLRHSLEFSDNAAQALTRLQNFIQHNPGSSAAESAKKDLSLWQDRGNRHLVKIGDDWITPEDARQLREQTIFLADHARHLIRGGDVAGAGRLINQIVAVDPHSVAGLYLQGVLAWNANQIGLAERDFLAVAALAPHHGPTLNNLAVLSFRSQHYAQSASRYDEALQADPLDREIVDNVAETLHAFPPDDATLPEVRLLQEEFVRQDTALQQMLAKQNLSRYGAKWITAEQSQQIRAAQKIMQEKLGSLTTEQTQVRATVTALDQQIAANEQSQQQMVSTSYVVNPATGRMVYTAYPQAYYDLERDDVDLKARRQTAAAKLEDIATAIRSTQTQLPIQPYTGIQQIIGEEGTPIAPPTAATTRAVTTKPVMVTTKPAGGI